MGIVYRAYDPHLGRTVAIKTISLSGPEFLEDEQYRPRFLREARAAGRLSHPGIVTVFDVGEDAESGEPYLVMEHVSGEPLSRVLGRNRKLPLSQALQFAEEIAQALDYAHNQGVIHRDIKPSNILITDAGHAKIADFGVAWLNREMSQIGEVVGSPAYMAPEQMAGKQADARSDLFSLGVVLYTMLTGFRPFQGNSAKTVCFKVMNIEPVPVTSFQSEILPELDAIVSRAIAKDPDERFSSGAELANALESFKETDSTTTEGTGFFARAVQGEKSSAQQLRLRLTLKRKRQLWSSVCAAVVLAGTFVGWQFSRLQHSPAQPQIAAKPASRPLQETNSLPVQALAAPRKLGQRRPRPHKAKPALSASTKPAVVVPPAKVQVEIEHHFDDAKASVWLDDDLVLAQSLHGPDEKRFLHSVEVQQVTNVEFAPGKHWVQVRVVSPKNKYDQIETIISDLQPGSEHVLSVRCEKHKLEMVLQ
jgi:serine/threonine protein kinase